MFKRTGIFAALLLLLAGCSKVNELRDRIDDQNERLAALENLVEVVNDNAMAVSALFNEKILITDFQQKLDETDTVIGYVLTLSDGQKVEVTFGDRLEAVVPMIGVNDQGEFIYSMDGGETFERVEGADNALAIDGVTPEIALDADGYWTVSVDGGGTWTRMLDGNGLPVNAFQANSATGNAFFSDVRYDEETGIMHFDLKTGESLQVRVTNTLVFSIAHYTEGEEVCLGEEMKYPVDYTNVKEAFFSVPDGWRATLDEESLTVYAPESGDAGRYDIVLTLVSPTDLLNAYTFTFTLNPVPVEPKWKLDWEDEFDKGYLDESVWSVVQRANTTALRYMSSDPRCYEFRDGCIVMKAIVNDDLEADPVPYLTGGIYSKNLKEFKPGRIEVRARIKGVQGSQPAIWTGSWAGTTWPWGGEIDIMERYNKQDAVYQTVHSHYTYDLGYEDNPVNQVKVTLNPEEFHVYAVELWPDELIFLIDGEKTLSYPRIETTEEGQFPFYSSVYLFLDMQIINEEWGGAVDDAALPSEIEIDWVRHYLWK